MPAHERGDILPEDVPEKQLDVPAARKRLPQHALQRAIQLDGEHLSRAPRKLLSQAADARPDLQHGGIPVQPRAFGDLFGHPAGDQKILSHGLGKAKAVAPQQLLYRVVIGQIHDLIFLP